MNRRLILEIVSSKIDVAIITTTFFAHNTIIRKIMNHPIFRFTENRIQQITLRRLDLSNGSMIRLLSENTLEGLRGISWDVVLCQSQEIKDRVERRIYPQLRPGGEISLFRMEETD